MKMSKLRFSLLLLPLLLLLDKVYAVSTVTSTDISSATQFPFQRKSFYANGRYWLFFVNSTDYIYTSSTDGINWEKPQTIRDEPNMHASTTTRYFTSWSRTVNGKTEKWLSTKQSDSLGQVYKITSETSADWGIRVYLRNYTGHEFLITPSPVAIVSCNGDCDTYKSATWQCPDVDFNTSADSIKVEVMWRLPSGTGTWESAVNFTTKQLEAGGLASSIWNVTYRVQLDTGVGVVVFDYGRKVDANSRIENFTLSSPQVPAGYKFSIWFDGTFVSYALSSGYSYSPLIYRRGLPNSDGNISWSTFYEQIVDVSEGPIYHPFISVDSQGYPFIGYLKGSSAMLTKSSLNNGEWSTQSTFPKQLTSFSGNYTVIPIPLASQKVEVFYFTATPFSACKALANQSEENVGFCQVPTWKGNAWKMCVDFINMNPKLDGDVTGGIDSYASYPDGFVDTGDTLALSVSFGTMCGDPDYEQMYDVNNDCSIDDYDIDIVTRNYAEHGDYVYDLTGTYITFDTGENRTLDSSGCTFIPSNAKNFTVYNSTDDKVGAMVLFYSPPMARLWNGTELLEDQPVLADVESIYSLSIVARNDDVHMIFLNTSTHEILHVKGTYNPVYQNYTFSQPMFVAQGTSTSYPVLSASWKYLYVFWAGYPELNHIYYKKYFNGQWDSSATDWITETALTGNNTLSSFYEDYGGRVGVVWMNSSSSPYQVRFDYLKLSGWLNVTLYNPLPNQETQWYLKKTFTVNASIQCEEGYCTGVEGVVRYNATSLLPSTPISTVPTPPFYVKEGMLRPREYRVSTQRGGTVNNPGYAYDKFYNDTSTYAEITTYNSRDSAAINYTFYVGLATSARLFVTVEGKGIFNVYNFTKEEWEEWFAVSSSFPTINSILLTTSNGLISPSGYVFLEADALYIQEQQWIRLYDTFITITNNTLPCEDLDPDESCILAWQVEVTGTKAWKIDVNFTSLDPLVIPNDTEDATVNIVWLDVDLLTPKPNRWYDIVQNSTLLMKARVTCRGGWCGFVNGTSRYNSTSPNPDSPISTSFSTPFYILQPSNPLTCGNLSDQDTCQLNWSINVTGPINSIWKLDAYFDSSIGVTPNDTQDITIRIIPFPNLIIEGKSLYYYTGEKVNGDVTLVPLGSPYRYSSPVQDGEWVIKAFIDPNYMNFLTLIVSDDEKIGYNNIKLARGETLSSCSLKELSISGFAVDEGRLIDSGTVEAKVLETSYRNSSSFSGEWSLTLKPCLVSGKVYTIEIVVTDDSGKKRGEFVLEYPVK